MFRSLMFTAIVGCFVLHAATASILANDLTSRRLEILPLGFLLSSSEARQTLVAQWKQGDQFVEQAAKDVVFTSGDPKIVKIEEGIAIPVTNGQTTITATIGGAQATTDVTVSGQDAPFTWSFRNHVESVLSKSGCNSGACHGARAGKNGFRLTLFGFDLDADYTYLTRQALGRRIVPSDPGRSLLLTKPTGAIPHKGGVRFDPQSVEYRVLAEWIASGAPGPAATDPQIESLEVLPKYSRQTVGANQQLIVQARFSDGHVEDVTRWAKFTSVNASVAGVDDRGRVSVAGSGEGAVKVWYLNYNVLAFLSVPYPNKVAPETFAAAPRRNFIDGEILTKLESLQIPPSPRAGDATFIRRAYLDTLGLLPTADEVRDFLADATLDKRDRLIDHLLSRPEFVDYWAYKWSDLLLVSGERLRPKAINAYYQWIRSRVADNTPWDKFVYDLVTASGHTHENGAANFYALHQDPTIMAETMAQAFMGLSINCAKCHNHPLEKWTNDQYYGLANMFSRVKAKGWGGDFRSGEGDRIIFADTQGELLQPDKGQPQAPRPLDGEALSFNDATDRRVPLAKWLVAPENPYFARAITNRIWANYFGVGLVEKVDDLRVTNPASNEKLLDAAARYLVEKKFDLKELMRAILQSEAYQRAGEPLAENKADDRFYSRYYPRRLKAEVLLDALSQVSGDATVFKDQKKGVRAIQLADSFVDSYFLEAFGRPDRLITCDCERSDEPSMTQVLHIYNGNTLNDKLGAKDNMLEKTLAAGTPDDKLIEDAYLSSLSRLPTESEKTKLLAAFAETPAAEKRLLLEDLYWSILSSREFLFNH